jgi:hypothetical protein
MASGSNFGCDGVRSNTAPKQRSSELSAGERNVNSVRTAVLCYAVTSLAGLSAKDAPVSIGAGADIAVVVGGGAVERPGVAGNAAVAP